MKEVNGDAAKRKEPVQYGKVLLSTDNISFSAPDRMLFSDVNIVVRQGENIALTGESGSGKTVLLKVLLGELLPDEGSVETGRNVRISYVPQVPEDLNIDPNITVRELFYRARGLDELETRKAQLEERMAEGPEDLDAVFEEYGHVVDQFEKRDGYVAESQAEEILAGLKMDEKSTGHVTLDTRLTEVSSGQRTRLLIGQALFAKPDLLVLDDPSSHLDVQSVAWLGQYLKKSEQAAVIATNNLDFINAFSNKVVEITQIGRVLSFEGSYTDFTAKRDQLLASEAKAARYKRENIERIEETIKYFTSRGTNKRSADMAQVVNALESRVEREKRELDAMPGAHPVRREERVPNKRFETTERSGNDVISILGLQKKYGDYLALDLSDLEFTVQRGETFVVAGENGSGKSTLLRMIGTAGRPDFEPTDGVLEVGSNVRMAYYSPDHEDVGREGTIVEEAAKAMNFVNEGEIKATLAYWGFSRDDIKRKTVRELSRGERTQLALAKVMLQKPNLLVLDEPTNNLRPEIIERFVKALEKYDGTVILVSHDPSFVERLKVKRTLHLPEGNIELGH